MTRTDKERILAQMEKVYDEEAKLAYILYGEYENEDGRYIKPDAELTEQKVLSRLRKDVLTNQIDKLKKDLENGEYDDEPETEGPF